MTSGKIYKWTSKKSRDIPLPEIAREILECKSDKIYNYYPTGDKDIFDKIVGCDDEHVAAEVVAEVLDLDVKDVIDKIEEDRPASWFIREGILPRLWDWSNDESKLLYFPELAKTIIKYNIDKIYRFEEDDEFSVVVGTNSKESAAEVVVEFELDGIDWDHWDQT